MSVYVYMYSCVYFLPNSVYFHWSLNNCAIEEHISIIIKKNVTTSPHLFQPPQNKTAKGENIKERNKQEKKLPRQCRARGGTEQVSKGRLALSAPTQCSPSPSS